MRRSIPLASLLFCTLLEWGSIEDAIALSSIPPARSPQTLSREQHRSLMRERREERRTKRLSRLQGRGTASSSSLPATRRCGDGHLSENGRCPEDSYDPKNPFPLPRMHGALRIEQLSGGTGDAAAGATNVPLLTFDALAGRQDVFLQGLTLRAETGTLSSAERYSLFADMNGDGKPETLLGSAEPPAVSLLVFRRLQLRLRDGIPLRLEVRADLRRTSQATSLALAFATSEARFIEAQDSDGKDLSGGIVSGSEECTGPSICWIRVQTRTARTITTAEGGNLFIVSDPSPERSHQLLLGERSDTVLRLRLSARGEDILLTSLAIGGGTESITALELLEEGASQPFALARPGDCDTVISSQFCARAVNGILRVPKDREIRLVLRAIVKSDDEGGTTGRTFTPTLTDSTQTNVAAKARGAASDQTLSQNDGDSSLEGEIVIGRETAGANFPVIGNTHDLVGAKIGSIEKSSTDPDESPVPTGTVTLGRFRFTALPHRNTFSALNPVNLKTIVFTVTAPNVQMQAGSFLLFNAADPGRTTSCTSDAATGTITVTCTDLFTSSVSTVIGQGSSIELGLRGTVTSAAITPGSSTLLVSLGNLGSRSIPGTVVWDDGVFPFSWVDVPASSVRSTMYRTR